MLCPRCKLESPPDAEICDCGYLFHVAPERQPPRVRKTKPPSQARIITSVSAIGILALTAVAWLSFLLDRGPLGDRGIMTQVLLVISTAVAAVLSILLFLIERWLRRIQAD